MGFYVTDDDYYEDDEEDDPDALKDPIYQIDLQVHSFWICFLALVYTILYYLSQKVDMDYSAAAAGGRSHPCV